MIKVVFPSSSIRICLFLLSTCWVNHSWIDRTFFNQNPCIPSYPIVFQFSTFLSTVFRESTAMFVSGPSYCPWSYFTLLFFYSAFVFLLPNFNLKLFCFLLHLIVALYTRVLFQVVGWIFFRDSERSSFVSFAWPCFFIFRGSFLSTLSFYTYPPVIFSDFVSVVFSFLLVFSFHCVFMYFPS